MTELSFFFNINAIESMKSVKIEYYIVEIKDMLEMFYPNIILESFGPGTRRSLVGPHDERIIFG